MVYSGSWGDWTTVVTVPNKYVKLASVRFEDSQGGADDTAMNGLQFRYETPNNGATIWSSRHASSAPTPGPTNPPTPAPTEAPTPGPTNHPTPAPTEAHTSGPINPPTPAPTEAPVSEEIASPVPAPQLRASSAQPTHFHDQKLPDTSASAAPSDGTTALVMLMVGLLSVFAI